MWPGVGEVIAGIVRVKVGDGGRGGARQWSFMPMAMRERQKTAWMWRIHRGRSGIEAVVGGFGF